MRTVLFHQWKRSWKKFLVYTFALVLGFGWLLNLGLETGLLLAQSSVKRIDTRLLPRRTFRQLRAKPIPCLTKNPCEATASYNYLLCGQSCTWPTKPPVTNAYLLLDDNKTAYIMDVCRLHRAAYNNGKCNFKLDDLKVGLTGYCPLSGLAGSKPQRCRSHSGYSSQILTLRLSDTNKCKSIYYTLTTKGALRLCYYNKRIGDFCGIHRKLGEIGRCTKTLNGAARGVKGLCPFPSVDTNSTRYSKYNKDFCRVHQPPP